MADRRSLQPLKNVLGGGSSGDGGDSEEQLGQLLHMFDSFKKEQRGLTASAAWEGQVKLVQMITRASDLVDSAAAQMADWIYSRQSWRGQYDSFEEAAEATGEPGMWDKFIACEQRAAKEIRRKKKAIDEIIGMFPAPNNGYDLLWDPSSPLYVSIWTINEEGEALHANPEHLSRTLIEALSTYLQTTQNTMDDGYGNRIPPDNLNTALYRLSDTILDRVRRGGRGVSNSVMLQAGDCKRATEWFLNGTWEQLPLKPDPFITWYDNMINTEQSRTKRDRLAHWDGIRRHQKYRLPCTEVMRDYYNKYGPPPPPDARLQETRRHSSGRLREREDSYAALTRRQRSGTIESPRAGQSPRVVINVPETPYGHRRRTSSVSSTTSSIAPPSSLPRPRRSTRVAAARLNAAVDYALNDDRVPYFERQDTVDPDSEMASLSARMSGVVMFGESASTQRSRGGSSIMLVDDDDDDFSDGQVSADSDFCADEVELKQKKKVGIPCGCIGIKPATQAQIMAKPKLSDRHRLELAQKLRSEEKASQGNRVCDHHIRRAAGKLGLQIKHASIAKLEKRVMKYGDPATDIGKLKTDGRTASWFRKSDRPWIPSDGLGPYAFFPEAQDPIYKIKPELQLFIRQQVMTSKQSQHWEDAGSIVLDNIFDYWDEPLFPNAPPGTKESGMTLLALFRDKMCMYEWHQREINGRPNYGWLRDMYHGLCQQVMRQDLSYYRAYISLRPDCLMWLITYPYYAKFTRPGDSTAFRHVDINIQQALSSGRGINQIQGSVSLDNEDAENCTVLIPGLHRREVAVEWLRRLNERGQAPSDGFVNKIQDKHFTKADAMAFGTGWISEVCNATNVRISHPLLPHGSTGPATKYRRTMLPWYVGVMPDHKTLEIPESGTWDQIATAHRDLFIGPSTPSGFPVNYGAINFKHPCSVSLRTENPLGLALVGHARWDDPAVQEVLNNLIRFPDIADHMIREQRNEFKRKAHERYQLVVKEEMRRYPGKKSFYRWQRSTQPDGSHGWRRPAPDEETPDGVTHYLHADQRLFEEPIFSRESGSRSGDRRVL